MMGDEQPEPPKLLAYHDGKRPTRRGEDTSVLATVFAWAALGFSAVPWGAVAVAQAMRTYAGGGLVCCAVFPFNGLALLSLLLWITSERRGSSVVPAISLYSLIAFWILTFAAAMG